MPYAGNRSTLSPLAQLLALDAQAPSPALDAPSRPKGTRKMQLPTKPVAPVEPEGEDLNLMDYAPTAVRAVGGLFGVTPVTGAIGGGLSELAAEAMEGRFSPSELLAATGVGAAGGGLARAVIGAGNAPLRAALAAAPWAAAQPVIHQAITEGEVPLTSENLKDVAVNTAVGSGAAAGMAGLLKLLGARLPGEAAKAAKPLTKELQLEQTITSPKGGSIGKGLTSNKVSIPVQPEAPGLQMLADDANFDISSPRIDKGKIAYGIPDEVPAALDNELNLKELRHAAGAERSGWDMIGKEREDALAENMLFDARRQAQDAGMALEATPPRESYSAPIPGGRQSMSRRFVEPAEEGAEDAVSAIDTFTPPQSPQAASPVGALSKALTTAPSAPTGPAADDIRRIITEADAAGVKVDPELRALAGMLDVPQAAPPTAGGVMGIGQGREPLKSAVAPQRFGIEGAEDALEAHRRMLGATTGPPTGPPISPEELAGAYQRDLPIQAKAGEQFTPEDLATIEAAGPPGWLANAPEKVEDFRTAPPDVERRINEAQALRGGRRASDPTATAEQVIPLADVGRNQADVSRDHYLRLKEFFAGPGAGVSKEVQRTARNKVAGAAASRTGKEATKASAPIPEAQPLPLEAPSTAQMPVPEAPVAPQATQRPGLMQRLLGQESGAQTAPTTPAAPELQALLTRYQGIANPTARQRFADSLPLSQWQGLQRLMGTRPGFSSEMGAIDPMAAASLGLGLAGGVVGGAMDPLDNPIMSALAGAGVGAALPTLASKVSEVMPNLMARPDVDPETKGFLQTLSSPEGMMESLKNTLKHIPHMQRANMLASPNIINNAFIGPWTSGLWLGIERTLAGDPAGIEMIKAQRPDRWARRYYEGWDETTRQFGQWEKADQPLMGDAKNMFERAISTPGTIMTGGDMATRGPARELFGEGVARRATSTQEPEWAVNKAAVNFQRSGPVAQTLFPFARTLLNLTEEGVRRTPVLGSIEQSFREVPDDAKLQLVQQLLGGAAGAGGYVAGQNLDDIARAVPGDDKTQIRFLRNFLSNAAGPNSALMNVGMAAGAASELGKSPVQQLGAGIVEGAEGMPLPTMDPLIGVGRVLQAEPGKRKVPSGVLPGPIRDYVNEGLADAGPNKARKPQKAREKRKGRDD